MGVEQRVSEEELIETLTAFEKKRVEQLEEPARNLFYAIMKIASERDRLHSIIKEVREYIDYFLKEGHTKNWKQFEYSLLEILDKVD